jgi:hypothetical protein
VRRLRVPGRLRGEPFPCGRPRATRSPATRSVRTSPRGTTGRSPGAATVDRTPPRTDPVASDRPAGREDDSPVGDAGRTRPPTTRGRGTA